ncbi:MAG TPA: iron ABC transporter substrate-binding protein, partial [Agrobacterium sp.]|nr:iron ABC transporter substrate-binding protein [Agrobacterium sp.]
MAINFTFPVRLLAAAAFSLGAMTASAEEMTIKHAQGETVLKAAPKKVLVLDVPSLDNLDALGVEPTGVVGSNLPTYLQKY